MTPKRLIDNYLPADYQDTYSREVTGKDTITADELFRSMMLDSSKWIDGLMKLRDTLVKPFGLKAGDFKEHVAEMIQCRNEHELVWGMNDRHLQFYASMWCDAEADGKQTVGVTTLVKYNNTLGKTYFFFIRPFHKIIIKSQLKKSVNKLSKK